MKTIKLAWKIFKFFTLVLPILNMILDAVATRLELQKAKEITNDVR